MPEEYASRKADKLHYRWAGGCLFSFLCYASRRADKLHCRWAGGHLGVWGVHLCARKKRRRYVC